MPDPSAAFTAAAESAISHGKWRTRRLRRISTVSSSTARTVSTSAITQPFGDTTSFDLSRSSARTMSPAKIRRGAGRGARRKTYLSPPSDTSGISQSPGASR